MKLINKFMWALLPMMSMVLFAACEKNTPEPTKDPNAPAINLPSSTIEANAQRGEYTVNYTITNAIEGETITANSSANWVTTNTSINGIIKIAVEANSGDAREATVEVGYKNAASKTITVKQSGKDNNQNYTTDEFHIEIAKSDYREFYINVYPKDKDTAYICMSATPEYISEGDLEEDEALFMDDMAFFDYLGMWAGASIDEVLEVRAKYGDQKNILVGNGCPDTEYIFYCYHIDMDTKELISPISRFTIRTKAQELGSQGFKYSISIDGPFVYVESISPKDSYDGYYYFDFFSKDDVDASGIAPEKYIEQYFNYMASDELASMMTPSPSTILETRCSKGTDSYYAHLMADTEYYLAAFAVNDLAICSSVPQIDFITSGTPEPSDMTIRIDVSNVGPYAAGITYTPSKKDYFVAGYTETEYYESMGATDQERRDYLISHFDFEYVTEGYSEKLLKLTPDTDYTVFAFGAKGGVPTTDIFVKHFTTITDAPADFSVNILDNGYYDSEELAEVIPAYAGKNSAVLPIEITTTPANATSLFYWEMYKGDPYDDANYMSGIIYYGLKTPKDIYLLEWDQLYTIAAIAADANTGQYTELVKRAVTAKKSGVSDVQRFIDWSNNASASSIAPASIVINNDVAAETMTMHVSRDNAKEIKTIVRYSQDEMPDTRVRMTVE